MAETPELQGTGQSAGIKEELRSAQNWVGLSLTQEKEHKLTLLGPDIFRWGGGVLPRKGLRAKWFGRPRYFAGISWGCPKNSNKSWTKFMFNSCSLESGWRLSGTMHEFVEWSQFRSKRHAPKGGALNVTRISQVQMARWMLLELLVIFTRISPEFY